MVSTQPLLLLVPATSAACIVLQPFVRATYVVVQVILLAAGLLMGCTTTRVCMCLAAGYCGFGLWQSVRRGARTVMLASVLELATFGCSAFKDVGCSALVAGALGAAAPAGWVASLAWLVAACVLLMGSTASGVQGVLAAGSVVIAGMRAVRL